jgi:hypothetical protein
MWGIWVSKDADLNVDFKNINLYYRQNAPKKSKIQDKDFVYYTGGPL